MEETNNGELGEFIRKRRIELGLSIRQLSERSGVDKGNLSRIENGKRSLVRATEKKFLAQVAHALEVDVTELQGLVTPVEALPPTRTYFRRKLGIDAAQADVLAKLVEDFQAKNREEARDEDTNQD